MARVALEPRVVHLGHGVLPLEPPGDRQRVLALADHAELQRLQPAEQQPAIERGGHGADGVLVEAHSLREGVVRGEHRAAEYVAVSPEKFRRAVDDHVGAELERTLQHRARERAVDGNERAGAVHELAQRIDVHDTEEGIGRGLEPDQTRPIGHRRGDGIRIGRIDRRECQPVAPEDLVEQPEGAAVHVLGEDDVVSRIEKEHHGRRRREAGREGETVAGPFERREAFLEVGARRIAGARVLESLVPAG